MAFYIKPPTGKISATESELYCLKRITLLQNIYLHRNDRSMMHKVMETFDDGAQHFQEGSRSDLVSHFLLRLAICDDSVLSDAFQESEEILFCYRLSCLQEHELYRAMMPLRKLLASSWQAQFDVKKICTALSMLMKSTSWHSLISHNCRKSSAKTITVPFEFAVECVAKREAVLCQGRASVSVCRLDSILQQIFRRLIALGLKQARAAECCWSDDERLDRLFSRLKKIFRSKFRLQSARHEQSSISAVDIEECATHFPLCMLSMHKHLRSHHRLPHLARVQYTLFLKDIGLPVGEAMVFWRSHYERQSHGDKCCEHSWQKDARRYKYSIRHLYGMEGARKNYRSHSCNSLQSNGMTHRQVGGCPFRSSDSGHLAALLASCDVPAACVQPILEKALSGNYSGACWLSMVSRVHEQPIVSSLVSQVHEQPIVPSMVSRVHKQPIVPWVRAQPMISRIFKQPMAIHEKPLPPGVHEQSMSSRSCEQHNVLNCTSGAACNTDNAIMVNRAAVHDSRKASAQHRIENSRFDNGACAANITSVCCTSFKSSLHSTSTDNNCSKLNSIVHDDLIPLPATVYCPASPLLPQKCCSDEEGRVLHTTVKRNNSCLHEDGSLLHVKQQLLIPSHEQDSGIASVSECNAEDLASVSLRSDVHSVSADVDIQFADCALDQSRLTLHDKTSSAVLSDQNVFASLDQDVSNSYLSRDGMLGIEPPTKKQLLCDNVCGQLNSSLSYVNDSIHCSDYQCVISERCSCYKFNRPSDCYEMFATVSSKLDN